MEHNETVDLHIKFQRSGLFSWVTLKVRICRLSVSEQNINLKTKAILGYNADAVTLLLKFWKREDLPSLWFHLFWTTKVNTVCFSETFQSCEIYRNVNNRTTIITTSLSIIMSFTDSITQHLQENNPLLHDLWSLSQSCELSINSNKNKNHCIALL